MSVDVNVEYCGTCGYFQKYQELSDYVKEKFPDVKLNGYEGRRATFEVKINGTLVHSKLNTMAFPDYEEVSNIIGEVYQGNPVRVAKKQQLITDCTIL